MIQDDSLTIRQKLERVAPEVERENYLRIGYVNAKGMLHTTAILFMWEVETITKLL